MDAGDLLLYAVPWCERCHRVRRFLEAAGRGYREVNPEEDREAREHLAAAGGGTLEVPALQIGETFLLDPSDEALADALGIRVPEASEVFDVAVVGAGPAGLTAAIYLARERLRTVVLERAAPGGQAAVTGKIENYPGFPDPIGGGELMERVQRQAEKFGAVIRPFTDVRRVRSAGALFEIDVEDATWRAAAVILATGSVYRRMGVPGEADLVGRGVSFCATCDAPFFRGEHVVVVGGGNSALQETVHLAEFASRITLVQMLDRLTGTRVLEERVRALDKVELLLSHRVVRVVGSEGVEAVEVEEVGSGRTRRIPCRGVFVFIGLVPNSGFLRSTVELDDGGFVLSPSGTLATSVPGIFAAGDVRSGSAKQLTSAVGEGTVASFLAQNWLDRRRSPPA